MLAVTPASSRPHANSSNAKTKMPQYLLSLVNRIPHPPSLLALDRTGPCQPADFRFIRLRLLLRRASDSVKRV
jgi:hypothetical protein